VVNSKLNEAVDSTASLTEEPSVPRKSSVLPTDVSITHEALSQTKGVVGESRWILDANFVNNTSVNPSYLSTVRDRNVTKAHDDDLFGTSSESYSKNVTSVYHNSSARFEKRVMHSMHGNISKDSEMSAKSGYGTVSGQKISLSDENHAAYPEVKANLYIIPHDFIGNPTQLVASESNVSTRNSTEMSSITFSTDISEGHSRTPCKHLTEIAHKESEISTEYLSNASSDRESKLPAEQLGSNLTENEENHSGNFMDTSNAISSRRTRDHSSTTELQMISKNDASRNVDSSHSFHNITPGNSLIISSSHTISNPLHSEHKFPNISTNSGATENSSAVLGGQFITISVENPRRSSSSSTGGVSRSSTDLPERSSKSSAAFFRNTVTVSSTDTGTSEKNFPVGE
jgi:hypothetical protein